MTKPITSVAVMMLYEEGIFVERAALKVHSSFKTMHVMPTEPAEDSMPPVPATQQIYNLALGLPTPPA